MQCRLSCDSHDRMKMIQTSDGTLRYRLIRLSTFCHAVRHRQICLYQLTVWVKECQNRQISLTVDVQGLQCATEIRRRQPPSFQHPPLPLMALKTMQLLRRHSVAGQMTRADWRGHLRHTLPKIQILARQGQCTSSEIPRSILQRSMPTNLLHLL